MLKNIRSIIASGLLVTILGLTPVVAAATNSTSSGTDDTQTADMTETEHMHMQSRVDALKKKLNLKLTEIEKTHLKAKCKPAQALVLKVHTRLGNSVTKRTQAYTELTKILNNLDTKLKAKNVDTTELETEITALGTKITTYQTDLTDYKQKLSDLKDLDCQTDPTAFQAALESARTARDKLITDVTDIRTYVKDTIKPTLQKIKTSLASTDTSGTN